MMQLKINPFFFFKKKKGCRNKVIWRAKVAKSERSIPVTEEDQRMM